MSAKTTVKAGAYMKNKRIKISVLLDSDVFERFDTYCGQKGFKKSTLVARLIRDHLDENVLDSQNTLPTDRNRAS